MSLLCFKESLAWQCERVPCPGTQDMTGMKTGSTKNKILASVCVNCFIVLYFIICINVIFIGIWSMMPLSELLLIHPGLLWSWNAKKCNFTPVSSRLIYLDIWTNNPYIRMSHLSDRLEFYLPQALSTLSSIFPQKNVPNCITDTDKISQIIWILGTLIWICMLVSLINACFVFMLCSTAHPWK